MNEELFTRAVRTYQKHCEQDCVAFAQPESDSDFASNLKLTNMHGTLARFAYDAGRDRLTFLGFGDEPSA